MLDIYETAGDLPTWTVINLFRHGPFIKNDRGFWDAVDDPDDEVDTYTDEEVDKQPYLVLSLPMPAPLIYHCAHAKGLRMCNACFEAFTPQTVKNPDEGFPGNSFSKKKYPLYLINHV